MNYPVRGNDGPRLCRRGFVLGCYLSTAEEFIYEFFLDAVEGTELFYCNKFIGGFAQGEANFLEEFTGSAVATAGDVLYITGIEYDTGWYFTGQHCHGIRLFLLKRLLVTKIPPAGFCMVDICQLIPVAADAAECFFRDAEVGSDVFGGDP